MSDSGLNFYLPLQTYPEPTPLAGLPRALDFCATLGGHLSVVIHEADIAPISNPLGGVLVDLDGMVAAAEKQSRLTGAETERQVRHQAERMGLAVATNHIAGQPELAGDTLARLARTSDFTLLLTTPQNVSSRSLAEAIVFGSGGPAVLFPTFEAPSHIQKVAIAWDGSRSAARALRDSLPILRHAGQVLIMTADHDKPTDRAALQRLEQFLFGHGIAATAAAIAPGPERIGDLLQSAALERECGLLVMGAYGHSRFREFVLGGATRAILEDQRIPVMLSH